jgi:hypothetical protein
MCLSCGKEYTAPGVSEAAEEVFACVERALKGKEVKVGSGGVCNFAEIEEVLK